MRFNKLYTNFHICLGLRILEANKKCQIRTLELFSSLDGEAPTLNCTDRMFKTDEGSPNATNLFIEPPVWDNADRSPRVVCSHDSEDVFILGDTQVTCTATDSSGNSDQCSFNVTIVGKETYVNLCAINNRSNERYLSIKSSCILKHCG